MVLVEFIVGFLTCLAFLKVLTKTNNGNILLEKIGFQVNQQHNDVSYS